MHWLTNSEIWIGLISLTALEIILGIDNVVFISLLAGKLPEGQQSRARRVGLFLALLTRIVLIFSLTCTIYKCQSMCESGTSGIANVPAQLEC